jgi:nucleoid DNA-binding protein
MNPKKANKLYKEVAEELDVSDTLVEETISFYYNHIRQMLSGLTDPRINVEGLGHFVVKTKMVKSAIPRYTKSLDNHDTSTFAAYFNKKGIETKLELLIELEKKIIKQEERKETFKKLKYGNNTENNLEGETQDS